MTMFDTDKLREAKKRAAYQELIKQNGKLRQLLERVDVMGLDLSDSNRNGVPTISPELTQLLSDIKEVLK